MSISLFLKFTGLISWSSSPGTIMAASNGASGEEPVFQCRRHKIRRFNPWVRRIPWRRAWQPSPIFLPGESHGQRGLAGYGPHGRKESETTKATAYNVDGRAKQRLPSPRTQAGKHSQDPCLRLKATMTVHWLKTGGPTKTAFVLSKQKAL